MNFNKYYIVDDDAEDRDLLIEALYSIDKGGQCFTAKNGEEGLKKLAEDLIPLPDFIFLDLNMPRLNGKHFLIEIKKLKRFSHIPVVIYTTSSDPAGREEMKQLGAFYYITKPDGFDEICNALRSVFAQKGAAV
jgi:CheY-like chemotaxis protein